MSFESHLFIHEVALAPSEEWAVSSPGWRFVRISRGHGYWFGLSRTKELSPGDMLVVAPRASGVVRASQIGEMALHYFHFSPELLTGLLTLPERHALDLFAGKAKAPLRFLPASHPMAKQFESLCSARRNGGNLLQRCQLLELVGEVFSGEVQMRAPKTRRIAPARDRFGELIRQLPESEIIKFTPDELARRCGCSVRHFGRLFRRQFGTSIRVRQTELRLLKAQRLLSESNDKVMNIAAAAGYRHLGLFNTMFKKRFGMTPSEWRNHSARTTRSPSGS